MLNLLFHSATFCRYQPQSQGGRPLTAPSPRHAASKITKRVAQPAGLSLAPSLAATRAPGRLEKKEATVIGGVPQTFHASIHPCAFLPAAAAGAAPSSPPFRDLAAKDLDSMQAAPQRQRNLNPSVRSFAQCQPSAIVAGWLARGPSKADWTRRRRGQRSPMSTTGSGHGDSSSGTRTSLSGPEPFLWRHRFLDGPLILFCCCCFFSRRGRPFPGFLCVPQRRPFAVFATCPRDSAVPAS